MLLAEVADVSAKDRRELVIIVITHAGGATLQVLRTPARGNGLLLTEPVLNLPNIQAATDQVPPQRRPLPE